MTTRGEVAKQKAREVVLKHFIPALPEKVVRPKAKRRAGMTLAMLLIEQKLGQPIETVLSLEKRGSDIAVTLGVSQSTITRWRERLGMIKTYEERVEEKENGN